MAQPVRLQVAQPRIRGSILCSSKILVFSTATRPVIEDRQAPLAEEYKRFVPRGIASGVCN